ncbi:sodium:calcium exchanger [Romeria aff. gracilis LEGE 07310]|uniref:Sodium:calcium exchanger n=1 Tax=Vasconcelosia minhoensis LEGE 07310 TaxID=915328 RepID=A0A8J7AUY1_9CYAN|nr:sodium:calcium exchanger [Romeria gracilis]MBE9079779.1 sodium:calcium exchanger [Romeria aff. gracilis LEGE 07310]
MSIWLWGAVLIAAVWAAHWGAERLGKPLRKLRSQWGLTQVAGASFVGIAAASPEIGINTTSAFRQVADIGLGTMLGSNIVAIPLLVTAAYIASRKAQLGEADQAEAGEDFESHRRHRQQRFMRINREAVTTQTIPYLGIVAVVALLTIPAPWRGLQPIDGWIMLAVYLVYLAQAVFRGRQAGQQTRWGKGEIEMAVAGVLALAIGAYFTVIATENIVSAIGISEIIGGLFITAPMAMLPELFATWSIARSGQITAASASAIGDHAVTMTIAFFPLALVTVPVNNFPLFVVNLAFVALVAAAYAVLIHWGTPEHGFKLWQVLALDSVYLIYLVAIFLGGLAV